MSYTIFHNMGKVVRDVDSKQVMPCQSVDDPDVIEYTAWCAAGNVPTDDYSDPPPEVM